MLHNLNNGGRNFPKLTEALRKIGMPEEHLTILNEYLDRSQPRNDALLDKITPQHYDNPSWREHDDIRTAQRRELLKANDKELMKRWHLFAYAAAGNRCVAIGMSSPDMALEESNENIRSAFQERFGDEAEARYQLIYLTYHCLFVSYFRHDAVYDLPLCLTMLRLADELPPKLFLCALILDKSEIKPQKRGLSALIARAGHETDADRVLAILEELYREHRTVKCNAPFMELAVAEAACFSPKWEKRMAEDVKHVQRQLAEFALALPVNADRILDLIDRMPGDSQVQFYIEMLAEAFLENPEYGSPHLHLMNEKYQRDTHLERMAQKYPDLYQKALAHESQPVIIRHMSEIYQKATGEELTAVQTDIREQVIEGLCRENETQETAIRRYLTGEDDLQTFLLALPQMRKVSYWGRYPKLDYITAYGLDDFAQRCIVFQMLVNYDSVYPMAHLPGFQVQPYNHPPKKEFFDIMEKQNIPVQHVLNFCTNLSWNLTGETSGNPVMDYLVPRAEEVAAVNTQFLTAEARTLAVSVLHKAGKTEDLFRYADDSSKAVREALADVLPQPGGEWDAQILELLAGKKATKRDIAVTLLEKNFPDAMRDAVQRAFDKEKNAGLQTRLAALLGTAISAEAQAAAEEDLVQTLTKGSKGKKADFLFGTPFSPVRKTDGEPADEQTLRALAVSYAEQNPLGRSKIADQIAEKLNAADLETFAAEAFARWLAQGAAAKTKWVLYLTAVHGGTDAVTSLQHYIKEWSENSRSAIAAEAVSALALNGSSPALMAVDSMARKFKNKQVRSTAGKALQSAADALGITREELADRIVPDLGFDEKLCRVFDFGTRQFQVYLTPALELEIFEGDKKLKNLPKPGQKDDAETAEAAVKDFKEMKKQMKAAIQSQGSRLEYALLCDRKWTAAGWRELFIRKPVMHCFAIGLIWGVYEDGKLVQSFRYMEDGTFNTPDEDEYELPENAVIGLVHPLELDEGLLAQWKEQLSDYEVKQPFPQMERTVYRVTDAERNTSQLRRFTDRELPGITLLGRMTKLGWDKGYAEDAGMFYDFRRTDVARQTTDAEGKVQQEGYRVTLGFSGMFIGGYEDNYDNIEVGDVEFYDINDSRDPMSLGEVPPRYFSEIVYQLTGILGAPEEEQTS